MVGNHVTIPLKWGRTGKGRGKQTRWRRCKMWPVRGEFLVGSRLDGVKVFGKEWWSTCFRTRGGGSCKTRCNFPTIRKENPWFPSRNLRWFSTIVFRNTGWDIRLCTRYTRTGSVCGVVSLVFASLWRTMGPTSGFLLITKGSQSFMAVGGRMNKNCRMHESRWTMRQMRLKKVVMLNGFSSWMWLLTMKKKSIEVWDWVAPWRNVRRRFGIGGGTRFASRSRSGLQVSSDAFL